MDATDNNLIDVRLAEIRTIARGTNLYRLQALSDTRLPSAAAGAHIDVHLANDLVRQYSLVINSPAETDYVIAVKQDAASRGGSAFIHQNFKVGGALKVSAPRNHFPLDETAPFTTLIAGGIGITPIYSMVQRLISLRKSWSLHYASRSRADMAFLAELPDTPHVHKHFDDESGGAFLDVARIVNEAPNKSHFYCCGPMPLMQSFEKVAASVPSERKHVEYFTAKETASMSSLQPESRGRSSTGSSAAATSRTI